ncbi:hypothetical protein [Clostridium saccharoperbutylacetonicum]|uniref:hypothetical protein n=1 Tax=Clostridium saccharoperbutylacetonicum TaxID=36745 RepID=UPI0039E9AD5C
MIKALNFDNEKNIVYLDYNIFVDSLEKADIKNKLYSLKTKYKYVYSSAYLEELANTAIKDVNIKEEVIKKDLENISKLTNNIGLRPTTDTGILPVVEHPKYSYQRVIDYLHLTKLSENNSKNFMKNRINHIELVKKYNINKDKIDLLDPSEVFYDSNVEMLVKECSRFGDLYLSINNASLWRAIRKDFSLLERNIEELFNLLEIIGYNSENNKKSRSRLHDVTHAIYATKANYFITNDNKFRNKCIAVYSFLGVTTKVCEYEKFISDNI